MLSMTDRELRTAQLCDDNLAERRKEMVCEHCIALAELRSSERAVATARMFIGAWPLPLMLLGVCGVVVAFALLTGAHVDYGEHKMTLL